MGCSCKKKTLNSTTQSNQTQNSTSGALTDPNEVIKMLNVMKVKR